ncbi:MULTISPECIES: DUF4178 domain-containing protein [unclassified Pseudoalteromonas]|uniref:DUF4178 domain-containing protein n=1 Tax=unclassified Pseudoalteromonas TaxID=194690 RepID=UPI000730A974|nr:MULTISPECIES: DUF4178 domain-containing protein [unclassified Pseudoalteromonas]KTD89490.1 hypothetical protein ATS71_09330 [Pseudoalteromonas sp. H71]TMN77623.1 hypothetical protein CWB64_17565 [Pseudoalteromonas sp. S410]TMN90891.1 hypothetical protein CWB62_08400 [Pseudoalteromonas sp. S408]TMN94870.1 hypothetical protein CWB61_16435 [Pseudoalteromonas sp. S407]TMN96499.1 hypothetical protein CWB63_15875 [Pseudoalteromonas sp. S409]
MFNFFKSKKEPERQLNHASELKKGDMFTVIDSFAYPSWLKGQTLRVIDVQTYQYQHSSDTEFVLETNSGQVVFLQIAQEDGEQWANFSIKVQRDEVDDIFTLDEFARIFDEESLTHIAVKNTPERFMQFLAKSYQQTESPFVCYFHNKDFRGQSLPRYEQDGGEPCEMICLASPDEGHSLNIEIWDGGETEVSLTLTRPITDIVDLFPGDAK